MEEPLQRIDKVLACIDVNWIKPQRPKQSIALRNLPTSMLFIRAAIRPAECVEHDGLSGLSVAKSHETHLRHRELTLVGNNKRNNIVLTASDFKRPFVSAILKIAHEEYHCSSRRRSIEMF
jgi:hypothetical protein